MMNTNLVADTMLTKLLTKHARVYRNAAPSNPTFPYVVFDCETINDNYPANDYYIYVNVYEAPNVSVRAMNTLADSIDGIDNEVISNSGLNMHITKVNRQFISNSELTRAQAINLQYVARVYFK
jgi:hypothetical protein